MDVKDLGEKLYFIRKMHKLSREDAAEKAGVSLASLTNYEKGITPHPSLDIIVKLASFYQVSIDYLLGRTQDLEGSYKMDIQEIYAKSYETYLREIKPQTADLGAVIAMSKSVLISPAWPYNLIDALAVDEEIGIPFSEFQIENLEGVIKRELTDRESDCIYLYFKDEITMPKIAEKYNVTTERIRQILAKALRKLRHPARLKSIRYGFEDALALNEDILKAQEIRYKKLSELYRLQKDIEKIDSGVEPEKISHPIVSLDDMDLSVRAWNCLYRYLRTNELPMNSDGVYELFTSGQYVKVRGFGKNSAKEVIDKLKLLGYTFKEEVLVV